MAMTTSRQPESRWKLTLYLEDRSTEVLYEDGESAVASTRWLGVFTRGRKIERVEVERIERTTW